ncbi:hypothetical protein [Roseateles sp. P5_E4]
MTSCLTCLSCCGLRASFALPRNGIAPSPSQTAVAPACGVAPDSVEGSEKPILLSGSGISRFDRALREETRLLNKWFRVKPEFQIFEDGKAPAARTLRRGEDTESLILIGKRLVNTEYELRPADWRSSLIGIAAHEWAHAFQYSTRLQEKRFVWETHADYLSGWYLGNKEKLEPGTINLSAYTSALSVRGDDSGYFDPTKYGSAAVRIEAMTAGYAHATQWWDEDKLPDVWFASDEGYKAVMRLRG